MTSEESIVNREKAKAKEQQPERPRDLGEVDQFILLEFDIDRCLLDTYRASTASLWELKERRIKDLELSLGVWCTSRLAYPHRSILESHFLKTMRDGGCWEPCSITV